MPTPAEADTPMEVDTASVGLVTLDTASGAITACNDAFAELAGRPSADVPGCPLTDFVAHDVKPIASAVLAGIRAGFISSADGRVDVLNQAGSVGVDCWVQALGSDRPHRTAMAGVVPAKDAPSADAAHSAPAFRPTHFDPGAIVLATLDDDWRIMEVAPGPAGRLGLSFPMTTTMPRLHELAHPADAPALDHSFGRRASTGTPDTFSLRLRGAEDRTVSSRVTVSSLHGRVAATFGLVARLLPPEEPRQTESGRVALLEGQLARIRQVVQSADGDGDGATRPVDLSELTMRQREVVERILDGHRVDAIARDLFVSPSTVRNHLSAIFEKFGVASQSELVELLRAPRGGAPGEPVSEGRR